LTFGIGHWLFAIDHSQSSIPEFLNPKKQEDYHESAKGRKREKRSYGFYSLNDFIGLNLV
jgi:hypothetical protein